MDWKEQARQMYFEKKMRIGDIAAATGVSRQSISACLKSLPQFGQEKAARREASRQRRQEYKREKNREYRAEGRYAVTSESIRREHDIAAMILSHEIYH